MAETHYGDGTMNDLEAEQDADLSRPAERPARELRRPLTDVTWEGTLNGSYLNAHLRAQLKLYWPALSDLAYQLQDVHPHLDEHTCRILVDAAANGHLPVLLTLTNGHREIGTIGEIGAHANASLTSNTWGFTRRYRLDEVAQAELPNAVLGDCGHCGH